MENSTTLKKWSELRKMPVFVPREGRNVGVVEDFYLKSGTNAIYALQVAMRVEGARAVPTTGIMEVGSDHVSIINAQMLTRALPPLLQAKDLIGKKVISEDGSEVGTVGEIYFATDNPAILRIATIELASSSGRRSARARTFNASEIADYADDHIIIYDRVVRL